MTEPKTIGNTGGADEDAFQQHLEQLRAAVMLRRPNARTQIGAEIARHARDADHLTRRASQRLDRAAGYPRAHQMVVQDGVDRLMAQAQVHQRRAQALAEVLAGEKALAVPDFAGPTPETASKPARVDPITWLVAGRELDHGQERAARVIAELYEAAARSVMARAKDPRSLAMGRPQGGMTWRDDTPAGLAWKHAHWYLPWVDDLHRRWPRVALPLTLAVCVWGHRLRVAARDHHMSDGKAIEMLRATLDAFSRRQIAKPFDQVLEDLAWNEDRRS